MDWLIWLTALGLTAIPVGGLLLDRLFDVPAPRYVALLGIPWLASAAALVLAAQANGLAIAPLVVWGTVGGLLGTVALDAVRLIGVRYGAFPLDMPRMFGVLLSNLAPALQRNMVARMVEATAALPDDARRDAMAPRIAALARLGERRREMVVAGMMAGLARLPEERRQAMLATQLALIAEAPTAARQALMRTMQKAMTNGVRPGYGQPRGMPRIPMAAFRRMADVELPRTVREAGLPLRRVLLRGYVWHFVMGATFGVQYTLLFGAGSWGLAIAWGVFVWFAMMVVMPPMMPMVRFPAWFPVVPLVAHVAFAVPLAWIALRFVGSGTAWSLLSLVGVGS